MRIIFLGTPEFAVGSLEKLVNSKHTVIAAITQPDKPSGRGNRVSACEVKVFAEKNQIPVYQFEKIGRDGVDVLKKLKPDLMVTAAYGQILTQQIIDIPKYGIINVHASLLPKYRGASPIQTAIMKGETETGITIMQTDIGLDTGDILDMQKIAIDPDDTALSLSKKLSKLGADMLLDVIDQIEAGSVIRTKQLHSDATFTKKIKKQDCIINWQKSAQQIKCLIMGANPDPVASTVLNGNIIKIYTATIANNIDLGNFEVGSVLPNSSAKAGVFVQTGSGVLKIGLMQLPGGKVLEAVQVFNGRKIKVGDIFEQNIQID